VPRLARSPVPPTDDWQQLRLLLQWPEQIAYEVIRPVVLFGRTPAQRAQETGAAERTLRRRSRRFDTYGMASLLL
jgi:putative transposase